MATFREQLRDQVAAAALAVLRQLGVTAQLLVPNAAALTIYVDPGVESVELAQELGASTDQRARTFNVPKQTGFPPTEGVLTGRTVVYDSRDWYIDKFRNEDGVGALYQLDLLTCRARRVGAT